MISTAALHTVVGLIFAYGPLMKIINAGLFNSVDPYYDRMSAFWYMSFGVLLFFIGILESWGIRETGTLPASLGWGLLIFGIIGVILMPISGFWLVLPQSYMILRAAKTGIKTVEEAV
jgi:hypothetical protein